MLQRGGDRPLHVPQQTIWGTRSWGFHTVRGGIDPGNQHFCPVWRNCRFMEVVVICGRHRSSPGVAGSTNCGFHIVRFVVDPGDHRFRPRFVVVVHVWTNLRSEDDMLSSQGGAWSTNPRRGFHTIRAGTDPGDHRFRPRFVPL